VYDESLGDPTTGIAAGTRFEDLSEEWICPECGAVKSDYDLIDD